VVGGGWWVVGGGWWVYLNKETALTREWEFPKTAFSQKRAALVAGRGEHAKFPIESYPPR
jgi:hypothetical protein